MSVISNYKYNPLCQKWFLLTDIKSKAWRLIYINKYIYSNYVLKRVIIHTHTHIYDGVNDRKSCILNDVSYIFMNDINKKKGKSLISSSCDPTFFTTCSYFSFTKILKAFPFQRTIIWLSHHFVSSYDNQKSIVSCLHIFIYFLKHW